jgi:hypothetical protein
VIVADVCRTQASRAPLDPRPSGVYGEWLTG